MGLLKMVEILQRTVSMYNENYFLFIQISLSSLYIDLVDFVSALVLTMTRYQADGETYG